MRTPGPTDEGRGCLILAHGAGSTAEFLSRAFPARECGLATRYLDDRTGSVAAIARTLLIEAAQLGGRYRHVFIGGVSVGAHAAAFAAAEAPAGAIDGCVLALPAWTGPAPAASATRAAAVEVEARGSRAVLDRLAADPDLAADWVAAELRLAWSARRDLAAELRTAASSPAPSKQQLAGIGTDALVIALRDDPFHPAQVAEEWAAAIPGADLVRIARNAPAGDRAVFGRCVAAWLGDRLSAPP